MRPDAKPPEVNIDKCTGCGSCVKACPVFVLGMNEGKSFIEKGNWCIECGHCGAVCPERAIIQERTIVNKNLEIGDKAAVTPKDCMQLLRERRSVRNYKDKPLSRETIQKIIEAGKYAPTGSNSQRVHYTVITSSETIKAISEEVSRYNSKFFKQLQNKAFASMMKLFLGKNKLNELLLYSPGILHAAEVMEQGKGDPMLHNAPALLIAHAEKWDGSPAFNCAIALYHCSLMAHTMGIGVCFNGWIENTVNINKKLRKMIGIPNDNKCFGAMTLGYQDIKYRRLVERKDPDVEWL